MTKRLWLGRIACALTVLGTVKADAMSLRETNVVDLLQQADAIVVGRVTAVTDGIDARGIPYTEVTLAISETLRGDLTGTYTFRQFGLLNPRLTADGKRKMMPAPEGFPKFTEGEQDLLFLRPPARLTGLRTTAGAIHGKFVMGPGRLENAMGNAGLFRNVRLAPELTTEGDKKLLVSDGAVNPETFLSFVRRAVAGQWVESGRMARRLR